MNREELTEKIVALRPWHHNIVLFDEFSTGSVFSENGTMHKEDNDGVAIISPREHFVRQLDQLYPDGMEGKTFLDCACNGGGFCFWAAERGIERGVGFDIREHWIKQARFVQEHRTVAPTDRLEFEIMDLYDLPSQDFEPFDLTLFSGIFYHLPDPVTGLKIAADLTRDVLILNTSMMLDPDNPRGLKMGRESRTKVMSGVYELAWFPTGKETLRDILFWAGFKELKVAYLVETRTEGRSRIEIVAAKTEGRLENLDGELLKLGRHFRGED